MVILNLTFYFSPSFTAEVPKEASVLGLMPMYHAMGMFSTTCYLKLGLKIVIMMKFEPDVFLKTLQDYKVSLIACSGS